ncbi:MAG: glycoside hydrolase family 10 protein [Bacillota bacterium]
MPKIKLNYWVIIIGVSLWALSLTAVAADVRPVLLKIRRAERTVNKAETQIKQAESEFRFFDSDLVYSSLKEAIDYLEKAEKNYEKEKDEAAVEYSKKAVDQAEKTILRTSPSLPVQVRGMWLDSKTIAAAGDREGLQNLMEKIQEAGFNLILPEVFYKGMTVIPDNELFVQDTKFSSWEEDPLQIIIEEAEKRDLQVHAWVWVFNENTHGQPGIILKNHPDWANKDKKGNIVTYHNSSWLSPASEEVRDFLVERYLYLVDNYDLDGVNLDYIRFPEEYRASYGFDEHTVSSFQEKYDIDPFEIESGSSEAEKWNKFREELITEMVSYTSKKLKNKDPQIIISADVIPGREEAKYRALQNWDLWLNKGYVDFVLPMTYTENLFDELSGWLKEENQNINHYFFPGISIFKITPEQMVNQILKINNINPEGLSLFAAAHLKQEHYNRLAEGPFREKAVIPYSSEDEAKRLIRARINKKIKMLVENNIMDAEVGDKLEKIMANKEERISLLNELEEDGKQKAVDILKFEVDYLDKINTKTINFQK